MNTIIHYSNCPLCGSPEIKAALSAKDHTVSKESFSVWECNSCTLRFTQDVPGMDAISPYYLSENYISHSNTSSGFINRLYQAVRKRTLKQKRRLVERNTGLKNGRLLDIGSGTGSFVHEMADNGWDVTGLEPDEGARKVARETFHTDLDDISGLFEMAPGSYDAITLWHVLEHVHELHRYIEQLKILLKENGRIFIAVPNYTSKDAAIYKENWAAWDVPRHLYHFSPVSVKKLMEKHGLKILTYRPMWYDSFYISMLSSQYRNGKPKLVAAFFNGLRSNLTAWSDVKRCSSVIYIVGK
jgi:SAM-dependent methyltransferase